MGKKIRLRSGDNHEYEVDEEVAMELGTVKGFLDDNGVGNYGPNINNSDSNETVPLPNVDSKPLSNVIAYCKAHLGFRALGSISSAKEAAADEFDREFVKGLDNEMLRETLVAASYLSVLPLVHLLGLAIGDRIKNKSVEYVRRYFNIENDYTPAEEAEERAKCEWAHQGLDPDD